MEKKRLSERLIELDRQINNRSPKPLNRLKASLAAIEKENLLANLPGSARRGLSRGHAV